MSPVKIVNRAFLQRHSAVLILVGLYLVLGAASLRFFQPKNLINIVSQSSITAIVALGLSLPILTGGIDLSVGSTVALAGAISAGLIVRSGWSVFSAIGLALLIGVGIGALVGLLVVLGRLPPFVASLSLMAIVRGITLVYTEGKPISGLPDGYLALGSGSLGPIPSLIIFLLVLALVLHVLLSRTRYGHHIYAIGGSAAVARLAGIPVGRITISAYTLSGFAAALSGVLLTARLWSAQPTAGTGLELEAIAAVVIGGNSLMGGYGKASGPVIGALIMGGIGNGLNQLKISSYIQQVVRGLVLIIAVMVDFRSRRNGLSIT